MILFIEKIVQGHMLLDKGWDVVIHYAYSINVYIFLNHESWPVVILCETEGRIDDITVPNLKPNPIHQNIYRMCH